MPGMTPGIYFSNDQGNVNGNAAIADVKRRGRKRKATPEELAPYSFQPAIGSNDDLNVSKLPVGFFFLKLLNIFKSNTHFITV